MREPPGLSQDTLEDTVRMVLLLLRDLLMEEVLVREESCRDQNAHCLKRKGCCYTVNVLPSIEPGLILIWLARLIKSRSTTGVAVLVALFPSLSLKGHTAADPINFTIRFENKQSVDL